MGKLGKIQGTFSETSFSKILQALSPIWNKDYLIIIGNKILKMRFPV
jgi:hypothetical protein